MKNRNHLIFNALNAVELLDKVLETCSINDSSPSAHALFVGSRVACIELYCRMDMIEKDFDKRIFLPL